MWDLSDASSRLHQANPIALSKLLKNIWLPNFLCLCLHTMKIHLYWWNACNSNWGVWISYQPHKKYIAWLLALVLATSELLLRENIKNICSNCFDTVHNRITGIWLFKTAFNLCVVVLEILRQEYVLAHVNSVCCQVLVLDSFWYF